MNSFPVPMSRPSIVHFQRVLTWPFAPCLSTFELVAQGPLGEQAKQLAAGTPFGECLGDLFFLVVAIGGNHVIGC